METARAGIHWTGGDLCAAHKRAAEAEYQALADDSPTTHNHRQVMAQLLITIGSAW